MFIAMKRHSDGETLQPIGTDFGDACKYVPVFPEVKHVEAWLKDSGFDYTCIVEVGFVYEHGCIVKYKEGEEPTTKEGDE